MQCISAQVGKTCTQIAGGAAPDPGMRFRHVTAPALAYRVIDHVPVEAGADRKEGGGSRAADGRHSHVQLHVEVELRQGLCSMLMWACVSPALGSNKYPLPNLGFNKLIQSDGNGSISFWIISATPTALLFYDLFFSF